MKVKKKIHECDYDKPENRILFKNGNYSDEQIKKCYGKSFLKLKEIEKSKK